MDKVSPVKHSGLQWGGSSQRPQLPSVPRKHLNLVSSLPFKVFGWAGLGCDFPLTVGSAVTPWGCFLPLFPSRSFLWKTKIKSSFSPSGTPVDLTPCSVSKPTSHSFTSLRPVSVSLAFLVPVRVLFRPPTVQHFPQHPGTIKGVSLLGRELQQLSGGAGGRPAKAGRWGAADAVVAAAWCGPEHSLPVPGPRDTPIGAAGCQHWRNTAVHHNLPSVVSSPVADNLPVVRACALSRCSRPGWGEVDLHGSCF